MKKSILFLCLMAGLMTTAQAQVKVAGKEAVAAFLKSTTYVVLEDNPFSGFNAYVNENMKNIWKVTPHQIITFEEFEKKMGDPKNSFMYVSQATFSRTKTSLFSANTGLFDNSESYEYIIISLAMGNAAKNINKMPDLCIVPVAYSEADEDHYYYKFGALIKFMGWYIRYAENNSDKDIRDIVKENHPDIKNYELWVVREELAHDVNTVEKISALYPYPVKITTAEEIQKAIESSNPKVAFLHKVGPEGSAQDATSWSFILTTAEGKPLYFSNHKVNAKNPDAFLVDDFKEMAK